jgi:serine/threonine protein kinase
VGAKDLMRKMLIVDPIKRVKIPEIRAHPWFQTDIPPYLALSVCTCPHNNTAL